MIFSRRQGQHWRPGGRFAADTLKGDTGPLPRKFDTLNLLELTGLYREARDEGGLAEER